MTKWKDIKTAPKDGMRILLFNGSDMYVAAWDDSDMGSNKDWVYAIFVTDWNYSKAVYNPTHWRELPTPPNLKNKGELK